MNKKGRKAWNKGLTAEEDNRILSGKDNPFYGKHHTDKTKKKLSQMRKGKHITYETGFKKGMIPWNKGIPWNKDVKEKISKANKGKKSRNKGIPRSKKTKEKISKANKGKKSWNEGLTKETDERVAKGSKKNRNWKDPEKVFEKLSRKAKERLKDKTKHSMYGKKRPDVSKWNKDPEFIKKRLKGLIKKPNKPEEELINIINQNNLPYRYVGDGAVVIYGLNPDFINTNGEKKIIELFGDYWHDSKRRNLSWKSTEFGRKAIFGQLGYDTLIIWEHELKNESQIVNKIINWEKSA